MAVLVSATSFAQVSPKVKPEAPVNGKSYVLVNRSQLATQYMSRTSWDGALYFLGEADSHYADYALTAISNADGSWSFSLPVKEEVDGEIIEEGVNYMVLPNGAANVNVNSESPAKWLLAPKADGFYNIIVGDGNSSNAASMAKFTPTGDLRMHLNAGNQYFVVTYLGAPWYPDCVGGITETEDEAHGDVYFEANDSISFEWGFVSPANVPAYYEDLQSVAVINKYYADYCNIEDYEDGFLATFNAVAAIYNSSDYSIDDIDIVNEMINAKVNLYKKIEAAIEANEAEDAVLAAAIANAQEAFGKMTSSSELDAATNALNEAIINYSMGSGDVTSLGKNMSFEDLSAQGGGTTSGVAGAPAGWNIYINGDQVITADDVRNAGVGAWHGVNDDSDGEIKDGAQSFGIWNGSIPTYELSQTISGLENGTYEITAGLMAGSNGSGSRLTTQRIFGNLNSTYYGSEYDYDHSQLDNSEVYAFAGNPEVQTDRTMYPVTVKAFVYDGTLTFGVRTDGNIAAANRTSSNGAGGDGWFKVDNFKIAMKGYVPEDAVAVFNHYNEYLSENSNEIMAKVVSDKLEAELAKMGDITTSNTLDEIVAAIFTVKDLTAEVESSIKAYEKLSQAIETHYGYLEQYDSKAGSGLYADAIMEAEDAYSQGSLADEAAVDALIASLNEALQACIQSDDIEEGMELTEYIMNPSFEDLSAQNNASSGGVANPPVGWSIYIDGEQCMSATDMSKSGLSGWCAINEGDNLTDVINTQGEPVSNQYTDGGHLWGVWSGAVPVMELSQTIKGLPAGAYTLTVDMVVQNDWAGMNLGMQRVFANDYVVMYGAEGDYVQNQDDELYETFPEDVLVAAGIDEANAGTEGYELKHLNYAGNYSYDNYGASSAPYTTTLQFGLAEKGDITLGVRTSRISAVDGQLSGQASMGWFKIDNFRLVYDSEEVPAGAGTTAEDTAVEGIKNVNKVTVEFYSVNGARIAAPQKGVNIVKMSDGTVSKVLVK